MCSNDGSVVRDWALAGQGVTMRSEWNVAADLAAGRLKRVLASWELPAADVVRHAGHPLRAKCARDGLSGHAAPIPCAGTLEAKDRAMTPGQ